MTPVISKVGTVLVFAAVIFYITVGRSFTWLAPPLSDTQLYAYVGNAWLHGDLPYVRVWDMKPPGIFAVNAAVFAFFPDSFGALAVLEGLFMFGCAITVYLLLWEWKVCPIGCCLGTLVFAITSNLTYVHSNLTEIYLLWPAALSMLFFSKALPELRGKWIFLSGLCTGAASLFKLTGLAPFLAQSVLLFLLWIVFRRFSFSRLLAVLSTALAGVILAWLPFALYFGYHGALLDLINASVLYPFNYSAAIPKSFSRYFYMTAHFLYDLYMLIIFILIGFCAYLFEFKHFLQEKDYSRVGVTPFYILSALWVIVDLIGALSGNRSHSQYFLPLTLSIAAMAGLTYSLQVESIGSAKQVQLLILTLLVVPLVVTHFDKEFREFVHLVRYGHTLTHDKESGHDKPTPEAQAKQIAVFIEGIRNKDDTLFSWDFSPWIFNALHIKSPIYVLDMAYRKLFSGSLRQRFVEGVLTQLQSHPPTFIMDDTNEPELSKRLDPLYMTFSQFVDNQYQCVKEFELPYGTKIRVYKRTRKKETTVMSWPSPKPAVSNMQCVDHSRGIG